MTSSESGPYRVGGLGPLSSSLSSNLSPLAPPFKVDRSLQKHNSTNTSTNHSDLLMYGPYFDSAGQLWNHSSSSATGSKFASTEPMGIHSTCSSSPTIYGYSDSQPSATIASVYHTSSGSTTAFDPFSYDPFPNSMSTTSEEGVKSYYSPYVPSRPQNDGFLSLGVSSRDCYDLLSNSASANLSGCGDGNHKRDWHSVRGGVNEQSNWSEYGQGFGSKESNVSDSLSSKSPFLVDRSNKSQPLTDVHTHPFSDGSSNSNLFDGGKRSNPKRDGCFDIFGGAYHLGGLGIQQDSRSLLGCSTLPTSVSLSLPKETSHLQGPVVESVPNFRGSQKANEMSLEEYLSSCGCTSTASTSLRTKNKFSYGESSFPAKGMFSAPKLNPEAIDVAKESNISTGYDYSYPVEPRMPLGLKRRSSIIIRKPPSSFVVPSSSQIGESLDSGIVSKNGSEKSQISPQMPPQFSPDGVDLKVNDAQDAYSAEQLPGGSDGHNPAEDSPCWRGASSSCFSSFAVSESSQAPQIKNFLVDSSDCGEIISEKGKEGNSQEKPFVPECAPKDNEERYSTTRQPLCFDLNTGDALQFSDEGYVSTKEGSGKCPPVVANESLDKPLSSENNHASSTPGDDGSLKHCQVNSKISDSNIDVNMLLKTLSNLSEILRCYCLGKRASVPEQHSIAIKQVIANLNASMLLMAGETSSTMPSSEVISFKKELPVAQMVSDAAFETVAAAVKLGGTAEDLLDSVSCKDDPNTLVNDDMTEAMKKILQENFQEEGEMDQQKLLYKSLWLDAEASLCAMTAKARFLRVKAEIERAHHGAKDKQISSSCNISGDANAEASVMARYQVLKSRIERPEGPSQESKESSGGHKDPSSLYASSDAIGANSPVLANHQTLKCRVDHDSLNNECNTPQGEYNSSSPIYQTLECGADNSDFSHEGMDFQKFEWLFKSIGALEEGEASVMARFRIIQSRIQDSNSLDTCLNVASPLKVVEDDPSELGLSEKQSPAARGGFGPYPDFTEEDENVDQIGCVMLKEIKWAEAPRVNSVIYESWYENDCSSSDWEHISKEDLRKTN